MPIRFGSSADSIVETARDMLDLRLVSSPILDPPDPGRGVISITSPNSLSCASDTHKQSYATPAYAPLKPLTPLFRVETTTDDGDRLRHVGREISHETPREAIVSALPGSIVVLS